MCVQRIQEGKLVARAINNSASSEIQTTTKPTHFTLTSDKTTLKSDGYDVAHILVQLKDDENRDIKTINKKVTFTIEGDAKLLGVDNGLADNIQDFQSNSIVTGDGRCLLIIQSRRNVDGNIKVIASIDGFDDQKVDLIINKAD